MYCIILCGGSGTRLWPLSRKNFPKQFLNLYSDKSLLQETFLRMANVVAKDNIFFVTNEENHYNVLNQIREIYPDIKNDRIIVEPVAHSTTAAITLAVKYLKDKISAKLDEPIIVVPSDHYIGKQEVFINLVNRAFKLIGSHFGLIGATPKFPHTGLGYIEKGEKRDSYCIVEGFKEKPDLETAEKFVESQKYAWNVGMFVFSIKTFEEELRKYIPETYELVNKDFSEFVEGFKKIPNISIDYSICEKSDNLIVFEGNFDWSDIGSFDILAEIQGRKKDNNPKHVAIDSKNIFTYSANNKLIVTSGVEDIIVIENNDSILVQKMGKSNGGVKKVYEYLKDKNYSELSDNINVHRPWGRYKVLIDKPGYKVKIITVYPGAKLSLQSHQKRSEHWVVVQGKADIVNGDETKTLKAGESAYIQKNNKHRLSNSGKENLKIIEVQSGDYLDEDDIMRYEDEYNRS